MKALSLGVFIVAAIYLIRFTPVKGYLTAESLRGFLEQVGSMGARGLHGGLRSGVMSPIS